MAKQQIFNTGITDNQIWTAQGAVVTWDASNARTDVGKSGQLVPILMNSISISFQRQSTQMMPLNQTSSNLRRCIIVGTPRGTLTVQGIYSPVMDGLSNFLGTVSNPCADHGISMALHPFGINACPDVKLRDTAWYLYGVTLESLTVSIQGGETAITNLPLTFSFTGLAYDGQ